MTKNGLIQSFILLLKSRIKIPFAFSWGTAVSGLIATRGFPSISPYFMVVISSFITSLSIYFYNDLVDAEFDKMNKEKGLRPMAEGTVSIKTGKTIIVILAIASIGLSYLINVNTMLYTIAFLTLGFFYSYPGVYLKRYLLMKETLSASSPIFYGLIGMYGTTNTFTMGTFFFNILIAIFVFTVIPLVDQSDLKEDKLRGMNSLALNTSHQTRIYISIAGLIIVLLLTPLAYLYFNYTIIAPIFIWILGGQLLRYLIPMAKNYETADLGKTWSTLFQFYMLSPLIFALSVYNIPFIS